MQLVSIKRGGTLWPKNFDAGKGIGAENPIGYERPAKKLVKI